MEENKIKNVLISMNDSKLDDASGEFPEIKTEIVRPLATRWARGRTISVSSKLNELNRNVFNLQCDTIKKASTKIFGEYLKNLTEDNVNGSASLMEHSGEVYCLVSLVGDVVHTFLKQYISTEEFAEKRKTKRLHMKASDGEIWKKLIDSAKTHFGSKATVEEVWTEGYRNRCSTLNIVVVIKDSTFMKEVSAVRKSFTKSNVYFLTEEEDKILTFKSEILKEAEKLVK